MTSDEGHGGSARAGVPEASDTTEGTDTGAFKVVGVGASAGGLEAFRVAGIELRIGKPAFQPGNFGTERLDAFGQHLQRMLVVKRQALLRRLAAGWRFFGRRRRPAFGRRLAIRW